MTLVALVTQATGRYCLESLNPAFAHVWVCPFELHFELLGLMGSGHGHRRWLRYNSHVLSHPILRRAQNRDFRAQAATQNSGYQTCYISLFLANCKVLLAYLNRRLLIKACLAHHFILDINWGDQIKQTI